MIGLETFCVSISDIVLEDNAELASRLSQKALPKKEYMEIDTGDGQSKYIILGNIL